MKIAVASQGMSMEAAVDPRFARAAAFVLVDGDTGEAQAVDNRENVDAAQGAGPQAVTKLVELGAQVVLARQCGPKAMQALAAAGIQAFEAGEGTVAEAVEAYKAGTLPVLEG
ncbi:MAG: NifB/NifX family molybdenum-iron cluster-binding protein [Candidatus Hydrogenedentes bacterium]|nr:NifB/NifX family molybdenum-iron cluster-binding protein [Candidatus Hydrogenedentota bacterium]